MIVWSIIFSYICLDKIIYHHYTNLTFVRVCVCMSVRAGEVNGRINYSRVKTMRRRLNDHVTELQGQLAIEEQRSKFCTIQ